MTSSNKRDRDLARAKAERQAARRAQEAATRKRRNQIIAVVAVIAVLVAGIGWFAWNRGNSPDTVADPVATASDLAPSGEAEPTGSPEPAPSDSAVPSDSAAPSESAAPSDSAKPSNSSANPAVADCTVPGDVRANDMTWPSAPADALKPDTAYTIDMKTNCGLLQIATEPKLAPVTTNSMVWLAEQGYFDMTKCHRLTTAGIYVLQCGDPAGDGTGGPGYSIPDENLPAEGANNYPAGTVAMANAGPGTGGSQFFIVYQDTQLPSGYTIWGHLTKGLDTVQAIATAGVEGGGTDGPPAQPVMIESAKVTTKG